MRRPGRKATPRGDSGGSRGEAARVKPEGTVLPLWQCMSSRRFPWCAGAWVLAVVLVSCTRQLDLVPSPPVASVQTTAGPWSSMIFATRTDSDVLVIDLGWTGGEDGLRKALAELEATPADVRWVFLTHAHRDHIVGWQLVPNATFVLGAAEEPYFTGKAEYAAFIPRHGDRLLRYDRPTPEQVRVLALQRDTLFTFGRDTVRAYVTPGHTPGSMTYLWRETLFPGDAVNYRPVAGFGPARPEFSDNLPQSRASMARLFRHLDSTGTTWSVLCTAHAKCTRADASVKDAVIR